MHLAHHLSLLSLTVSFVTALTSFAVSRAPGWRAARAFGFVALTAAFYSVGDLVAATPGLPFAAYAVMARWNYLWAGLHVCAWFPWTFGGPEARFDAMPPALRRLVVIALLAALCFAVTGWNVRQEPHLIPVPWAGEVYTNLETTPVGDVYGALVVLMLCLPFAAVVRKARRERGHGWVVAGFAVFFAASIVEVLVANRVIVFISPADIGFLAVVAPTAVRLLRRFVDDAERLHALSGRLAGEVRERTEERDRAETALVEAERLAALGRLAAGVGHEINNPLTYLQLSLERVARHLQATEAPADVRQSVEDSRDGAWRIQKVVEGLRVYSRRPEDRRALDPAEVARAALKVAHPQLRHVANVHAELASTPPVLGDEPRLVQALVNLLSNAAQAVLEQHGAGTITLRTGAEPGGLVFFEVEDDGPGIATEHRAHLSEPYFTTRASRGGLGLGLFVTRGIVDAHGGRLSFESPGGRGTRVRLTLPALDPAAATAAGEPAATSARPGEPAHDDVAPAARPSLLVVDDEPLVLRVLAEALGHGWRVTSAGSGAEALEQLSAGRFDAVVCDLFMPGVGGMDVAAHLEQHDPALRARLVFLTGGAVTAEAQAFLERPDVAYLEKPVDIADLDAFLRARIAAAPGA